ncbi:MAG: hypothetical protein GY812_06400 [Actinomycetia bacterium]|nr:hypothetical protein [Actinomycetes bacterium]
MRSAVVVSRTSSATQADLLVSYLRTQGIEATTRTNLDRSAYAGLGGATVVVPAEQRLEAEFELLLLEESRPASDSSGAARPIDDLGHPEPGEDPEALPGLRPARTWIRVGSWLALAGMLVVSIVPSLAVIWNAITG